MFSILYYRNPISQNNRNRSLLRNYRRELISEFSSKYSSFSFFNNVNLYGAVYYFTKYKYRKDADNISKPLWDALEERIPPHVMYDNDHNIKIRTAGMLCTNNPEMESINITHVHGSELTLLLDFLLNPSNSQKHLLYVEIGEMKGKMFKFDIERF